MKVHEAWAAVMGDVQAITKDGQNKAQGFNFRGIDGVMNAVGPALRKHGVIVLPVEMVPSYRDVEVGSKRTAMREVTMACRWRIIGPEGDSIDVEAVGEAMDAGDKGTAKAASVAYRTMLLQALTAPTHQPDPDEQVYERASKGPVRNPSTPGEHGHMEKLADIARIVKAWPAADPRRAELHRLRDERGWPTKTSDYDRATAVEVWRTVRDMNDGLVPQQSDQETPGAPGAVPADHEEPAGVLEVGETEQKEVQQRNGGAVSVS